MLTKKKILVIILRVTKKEFAIIENFRSELQTKIGEWTSRKTKLLDAQKKLGYKYDIVHPLVYNNALSEITLADKIKLIVIGDNPGQNEQKQNRYLVGMSGKLAEKFFREHPDLGIEFRKNTIILNKTPIHTAKTKELCALSKFDTELSDFILETQKWMAQKTARLHQDLFFENNETALMIVGYGELKERGIFIPYRNELLKSYANYKTANEIFFPKENASETFTSEEIKNISSAIKKNSAWKNVFVFQHFSMNRFSIDLKNFAKNFSPDKTQNPPALSKILQRLGHFHRIAIFGI